VKNLETEKHHWLLDPDLLLRDCATARLDVVGAKAAVAEPMEADATAAEQSRSAASRPAQERRGSSSSTAR
jgi:hypothetical protein